VDDYARSMACFLLDSGSLMMRELREREDVVKNGGRVCRVEIQGKLCLSNFSTTTSLTDRPATFPIRGASFLAFLHELPFLIEQLLRRLLSSLHTSLAVTEPDQKAISKHNWFSNRAQLRERGRDSRSSRKNMDTASILPSLARSLFPVVRVTKLHNTREKSPHSSLPIFLEY
jgi:hypothetical protein